MLGSGHPHAGHRHGLTGQRSGRDGGASAPWSMEAHRLSKSLDQAWMEPLSGRLTEEFPTMIWKLPWAWTQLSAASLQ